MKKQTTIAIFSYRHKADHLIERLNEAGIKHELLEEEFWLDIGQEMVTRYKIMVGGEHLEKALLIKKEMTETFGEEDPYFTEKDTRIKRILVPVDFSEHAYNACKYALGLAKDRNACLHLVHVYHDPVIGSVPFVDPNSFQNVTNEIIQSIMEDADEEMAKLEKQIKNGFGDENLTGVSLRMHTLKGIPEDEIVNHAVSYQADIIVIGTKSKDIVSKTLFGSITEKVILKANVPVLAIPLKSDYKEIDSVKNVMFASHFDVSDFSALRKLIKILRPLKPDIHCVHITDKNKAPWEDRKMKELKKYFEEEYKELSLNFTLTRHSNTIECINNYIGENNIDIICLTTHKRNVITQFLNPRIAVRFLPKSPIPFLVFHAG